MLPVSVSIHSMTPIRPKILLLTLMIMDFTAQTIDEIMVAEDASGETLGYAFTVTDSEGYGGDIQFAMGVQNDGTLNGISILSISETARPWYESNY